MTLLISRFEPTENPKEKELMGAKSIIQFLTCVKLTMPGYYVWYKPLNLENLNIFDCDWLQYKNSCHVLKVEKETIPQSLRGWRSKSVSLFFPLSGRFPSYPRPLVLSMVFLNGFPPYQTGRWNFLVSVVSFFRTSKCPFLFLWNF